MEEKEDEGRLVKRPKIETKIADDIVAMVDIVGYMTTIQEENETKRIIIVDPKNDKYIAKDRTGQLGNIIEPDFTKIINACQGTKKYKWCKEQEKKEPVKKEPLPPIEETSQQEEIDKMETIENLNAKLK